MVFSCLFIITVCLPGYPQTFDIEMGDFLLDLFTGVPGQQMDNHPDSIIMTPAWIQGNWLLNSSFCNERVEWVDRGNEGIILNIKNNNLLFNGTSVRDDGYYNNINRILTGRGNHFLQGDYFVIVFSLTDYRIMSHRFYYPRDNFMRVEIWTDNRLTGIETYNVINITDFIAGNRYITTANLRLRTAGNLSGEIIRTMQNGEFITVLEKGARETINGITSVWIRVRMDDGTEGWCFGGYVDYP